MNTLGHKLFFIIKRFSLFGRFIKIPYNMSNTVTVSQFLRRDINKAFAQVTGDYVNRGTGYGLKLPYIYRFYGPEINY